MLTYELHPLATIFPAIEGEGKFDELVADIKANGLRETITLLDGKILDGRNRATACHAAGIEPRFEEWKPSSEGDTPEKFVFSRNVARRHLTDKQRGEIAAHFVTNARGGGAPGIRGGASDGVTVGQAAEALGVKPSRVYTERERIRNGGKLNVELKHGTRNPSYIPRTGNVVTMQRAPHATSENVKADIVAFLQANEKRDTHAIDKGERVELALRFVKMLGCSDVIIRKPEAKPKPAPTIPQRLVSAPGSAKRTEPPPVDDDAVAAFLARGGEIKRCPPTINPTPEDRAALEAHHAEREAARVTKRNRDPLAGVNGGATV